MTIFKHILIILCFICAVPAYAEDIYITKEASGDDTGASCANAHSATWFNTAGNWGDGADKITAGDTVHLCGTFSFDANTSGLTFKGSGTNGNPITLLWEKDAIVQSPYFAAGGGNLAGGIVMGSDLSYLTLDGGTNGIIQNTANGDALANQRASAAISAWNCDNCTVQNLTVRNIYVAVQGQVTIGNNERETKGIFFYGSNFTVANNTFHDCGWCIHGSFADGDDTISIYGNTIYNFGHAIAIASGVASASVSNVFIYNNNMYDPSSWSASGCPSHHDGLHVFGVSNGAKITGFYFYNNFLWGDWGYCPTGMIYVEGNITVDNQYYWNNVFRVDSTTIENTNGWVGIFAAASETGVCRFLNNTIIGPATGDMGLALGLKAHPDLLVENNLIHNIGNPMQLYPKTGGTTVVDYNLYGLFGNLSGNSFIYITDETAPYGTFLNTFAAWKTTTGLDANSVQNNTPLLNTDGSPQEGSPAIDIGADLSALATGNLATLADDTTKGGLRVPTSRGQGAGTDSGAYEFSGSFVSPDTPSTTTVIGGGNHVGKKF